MLVRNPNDFKSLKVGIASPEVVRFWSYGEVKKPETINYRTFKPERHGLFCEKIFGPVKDWECSCGKYRRVRYRGIVCERCGVEVTHSKVRRERMGHIELATPVTHIWFLKGIPSYIGLMLDMQYKILEKVVYYDAYLVTKADEAINDQIEVGQVMSENEYLDAKKKYGNKIHADMGAKAIKDILESIDLDKLIKRMRKELVKATGANYLKLTKRIRIAEAFRHSGNKPSWMVLECVPVMPPDLRPMVQLEGGRFATSDLNDLYRRVINRNNRLKRLIDIGAPNMIVRNEKRMLQEAVDVLFDNGKRGRAVTGTNGRPLRSISDIIEGKQGRFRQNLLGKRVDYSGRSVIVVGPSLKLHQCGLPKEMAIELFKPFIIRELVKNGHVQNVKSAKRKIDNKEVIVYDVLDQVIKGHPVLLNRAPTLHRLGIQAFEPVLVEGKAIQIHPLVCTAFNADFDGDQMAVHVPLSLEAQAECRMMMMSSNNILSAANGKPIITPTQDMILGIYCLTKERYGLDREKPKFFADINEALKAYDLKLIRLQERLQVNYDGQRIVCTPGKLIFNTTINDVLAHFGKEKYPFVSKQIGKKDMSKLISEWYDIYGSTVTAELCDKLKDLGFHYATEIGISIAIDDLVVPDTKAKHIDKAEKEQAKLDKMLSNGAITDREAREKSHEIWRQVTAKVTEDMVAQFGEFNSVFIMAFSGARGNLDQVRQLAGMRGLMSDASGNTVDIPIKTNFREGLSVTEYFISSYGARKGIVDTALRTADSGYLTRRLVDIAQDVIITEEDCGTSESVILRAIKDGFSLVLSLADRLSGRNAAETIKDPITGEVIVKKGDEISNEAAQKIEDAGIEEVKVRSILSCKAKRGICQKCYGRDLATRRQINLGEAVGVISAQSIGEPGTQLTMRTFHTGGVDLTKSASISIKAKHDGVVEYDESVKESKVEDDSGERVNIVIRDCKIYINRQKGNRQVYDIPSGATLHVKNGGKVHAGSLMAEYIPTMKFIVAVNEGILDYIGLTVKERVGKSGKPEFVAKKDGEIFVHNPEVYVDYKVDGDKEVYVEKNERVKNDDELATGIFTESAGRVLDVIESGNNKIVRVAPGENYPILEGSKLFYKHGDKVKIDDIIAQESAMMEGAARDIVAGLPRVEELFEARHPKRAAVLAEINGVVDISEKDGMRIVRISSGKTKKEYVIPFGIRLKVFPGKHVVKGEALTDGVKDPHQVVSILGKEEAQQFLAEEVQKVYLSQGVGINDKHIETIIKQMTKKVRIREIGDSPYLVDDFVSVLEFDEVQEKLKAEDKQLAVADQVLLGLTKASLNTDSMISAASFQETTSVLTKAAVYGKSDPMYGLKENVIIGKLIPAGTGMRMYENVKLHSTNPDVSLEPQAVNLEEEVFKL
jgi:DNA-directed RNA polymerase subunit beta'